MLRAALFASPTPATSEELARTFVRAPTIRVADLGQARALEDRRYSST
jgi:hypothetical protein